MDSFIKNATVKLNEIAISMLIASSAQQNYRNSVKTICTLDELLNIQFKNGLDITLNTFKYISYKENKAIDFSKINVYKSIDDGINAFIEKKSDSFRTLAFVFFEIIILLNDSIEDEKITEAFFSNFTKCFNKLFIFEKEYLDDDISIKTLENLY